LERLWPFGIYAAAVAVTIAGMLGLSYLLGQQHREPQTGTPYEGGVVSDRRTDTRVAFEYYLVAAFFVVFDVETIFLFAWVVAAKSLGWPAFVELAIFVGLLAAALAYLWRVGALDWSRRIGQLTGVRSR
jgi:NADH-quinone oxidoreductase subunit A